MPDRDGDGAAGQPTPDEPDPRAVPRLPGGQPGRARELTRRRTRPVASPETGRRHHIGAAPAELAVLRQDGTAGVTRTAAVQLVDQTDAQLATLAERIESEMRRAAEALDFERAAHLRQEAAAARGELQRRAGGPTAQA